MDDLKRDMSAAEGLSRWRRARGRKANADSVATIVEDVSWLFARVAEQVGTTDDALTLSQLSADECVEAFEQMSRDGVAEATWVRRYISAKTVADWWEDRGHVATSPLRRVRAPQAAADRYVALLVGEYIAALKGKSERTRQAYTEDLLGVSDIVAAELGLTLPELVLEELTVRTLDRGFSGWADRRPAKASQARAHAAWSSWFNWLVARDLADKNPMPAIDKPKVNPHPPRRLQPAVAEGSVVDAVIAAAEAGDDGNTRESHRWSDRDVAAVTLLFFCGLRRSELCDLDIDNIIRARDSLPKLDVRGKGDKSRTVPLPHEILDVVDDYLESRKVRFGLETLDGSDALLVDVNNTRLTPRQLGYLVQKILDRSGVKRPKARKDVNGASVGGSLVHAFRHTYAFELLSQGADVTEVKELLGHESLATTQKYVKADQDKLHDVQRLHSGLGTLAQVHKRMQGKSDSSEG